MLSNSNVLILLILIKHSVLVEFTLAHSVAVNARAQIDDTKITTVKSVTTSHVALIFDASTATPHTRHDRPKASPSTKDPLVAENRKQLPAPARQTNATGNTASSNSTIDHDANAAMVSSMLAAKATHQVSKVAASEQSNGEQLEINSSKSHLESTPHSLLMGKSNKNHRNHPIIADNERIKSVDYVNGSNDDKNDDANSDIQLPQSDVPSMPTTDTMDHVAENMQKPRTDAVYFIVAVIGGAKIWSKTLAQTLLELGPPFSGHPLGSPLRPIYVDLPTNGRFSVNVLTSLCQQAENRPLAGVVVIGNGQSAHAVAHAGSAMQLPVLWAKGGVTSLRELHPEATLQALLQPSAIEIFEAVRSLFLQTHWHSFFVLSDVHATNVMNVKNNPLKRAPLIPTIVPLPRNNDDVFKQLAQISRSTRGVILLLGNLQATRRIMTEAHRLNMVGGHFIWLWIDTSTSTGYFHQVNVPRSIVKQAKPQQSIESDETQKTDVISSVAKSNAKKPQGHADKSSQGQMNNGDDPSTKSSVDFSQGFDPFRVLQRQDDHQSFGPLQHYQERNAPRDNKQTPANRLILGLRTDGDSDNSTTRANTITRANSPKNSTTRGKKVRRNASDDYDGEAEENGTPILLTNLTAKEAGKNRNFTDDNLDDFIDNNNFNDNLINKLNTKRTSSGNSSNSSYVTFHQFKDFPIGLLALRPIRMNVDRHFIRAAVRVFAATWKKINGNISVATSNAPPSQRPATSTTLPQSRRTQQNRNAQGTNTLYNAKKFGNEMQTRKQRRKRNIHTVNQLLANAMDSRPSGRMQVNNSVFLNEFSSNRSGINVGANNSDKNKHNAPPTGSTQLNSSFTSDLPTNKSKQKINTLNNSSSLTNVTVSFNRNFSGLWNKNPTNKSNIHSLSAHSETISAASSGEQPMSLSVTNEAQQTRNWANQASQSVVRNFFAQDIRHPVDKRTNTWRSTNKETAPSAAPLKRPQYDATNKNANQFGHEAPMQWQTPNYFGGCYGTATKHDIKNADHFSRALRDAAKLALSGRAIYNDISEKALTTNFELLNLVPGDHPYHSKSSDSQTFSNKYTPSPQREKRSITNSKAASTKWRRVGLVSASSVRLDTIVWPGGDIVVSGLSAGARTVFRIVTALAPPFVMESELDEDGLCLRGLPCHRVSPVGRHNLTLMFNAIETRDRLEEDAVEHGNDLPPEPEQLDEKISHVTKCCYGLTMDLLDNIATELGFEFHLYVVRDQLFGAKLNRDVKDFIKTNGAEDGTTSLAEQWNGIIGDLVSGSADMSFAPLSVSKARALAIDFSIPYFHSGVSLLASPKTKSEIPLLAFLLPFSPELWIAIFTSLNITAVAVAVYEWLSPFGLNPWGRQRSKNFSLSSALWVMWGLLCGHLVAFKAPKSWPNKFLINVWGGFSVIFVASYTANIAALIAGLFFQHAANSYDSSLTTQRVGAPIASAAESYVQNKDNHLWEHMKKYSLNHIEDGIRGLKNGTLDLLMADSPILDYYRATDHGCSLQRIGETFVEDTYAIGMVKGFPLRESISALIAKYSSNGYLDILTEKWYGGLPCFKFEAEIVIPRPLGVTAVAGVFLLLGLGMVMGVVILIFEHWFYKYALPSLRLKPKGTIWKSRNIMFFSQKLYRFINCVELVSPHHAARELVHSIRQGQIASLFQKSIKRKEDEQRRRRKSKAQFFEMIQEIRRAQQVERQNLAAVAEAESQKDSVKSPPLFKPRSSPKPKIFSALKKDGRSRSNSSVLTPRRFSTDSILGDRMDSIGRRLSRDLTNSPPDMNRRLEFGKNDLSPNKYDTISGSSLAALGISKSNEALSSHYDTYSGKNVDKTSIPVKVKKAGKRPKISFESYHRSDSGDKDDCDDELTPVKEGLEPSFLQRDRPAAILRQKLHQELRNKHPPVQSRATVTIVESVPNSVDRPPLPKKIVKHQRQKSLDNLDVQPDGAKLKSSPYQSDSAAGSLTTMTQRSQISLERLSREDLLRLSHSSQSEIHEYLKSSSMPDRSAEPP